jgi:Ca2+/Na+ antiporter
MNATKKLQETFDTLWNGASEVLPTFILGVLILVGGWLIAKLISKLVLKLLDKTKDSKISKYLSMDDISERLKIDISLAVIVSKLVYWVIFLFFVVGAAETFGWHNVSLEISNFISYLPKVLSALLIFALGYTIANFLRKSIKSIAKSTGMGLGNFVGEFLFYFLILIVSLTAMSQAGLDTTVISSHMYIIVAAAAVTVAIAVGLGSREVVTDLLKNYYNRGVLEEGMKVEYDGHKGSIVKISKTSVVIQTSKEQIVVPSKDFYASTYKIFEA